MRRRVRLGYKAIDSLTIAVDPAKEGAIDTAISTMSPNQIPTYLSTPESAALGKT